MKWYTQILLSWWRHQIETFSVFLANFARNSLVTGEFPAQRPVTRSFDGFFICAWINGWVNNHEAGDLESHRTRYDVTVMIKSYPYAPCPHIRMCGETKYFYKYQHSDRFVIQRPAS